MSYTVNVYMPNKTATTHLEGLDPHKYPNCQPQAKTVVEGGWLRFERKPTSIVINGHTLTIDDCKTCLPKI